MTNKDVRRALRISGIPQWKLAEFLGFNEQYFSRLMRHELSPEIKSKALEWLESQETDG